MVIGVWHLFSRPR